MSKALVAFDTDKIKSYIFATSALKEIVGASALIDSFNRDEIFSIIKEQDPTAEKVYADAGAGLFKVNASRADNIVIDVEKSFRKTMPSGSISGAWVPEEDDFKLQYELLSLKLRQKKDGKIYYYTPPGAGIFIKNCTSCGNDYACQHEEDGTIERDVAGEDYLCIDCWKKRKKDREIKRQISMLKKSHERSKDSDNYFLWSRLADSLKEKNPEIYNKDGFFARPPETFSDLAEMSEPKNYMALVYADGDGFGNEISRLSTIEEIRKFSDVVDSSIFEAMLECIDKHLQPVGGYFPFNILFHGGDDLVMVTKADKGIDVAKDFCEIFSQNAQKAGFNLTMSASVTITHGKYPFINLLSLGENSLAFAKNRGAQRRKKNPGLFDHTGFINFQVIHSSSGRSFQEDYQTVYTGESSQDNGSAKKMLRTLRPYTPQEIEKLLALIDDFQEFPRNKLYVLQESIFMGYNNSVLQMMSVISRLSENNRHLVFNALEKFAPHKGQCIPPWIKIGKGENVFASPFMDIVELSRFRERRDDIGD